MDYNGSVEEAKSVVRVSLFDTNRLRERRDLAEAWPLLKYERRKWRSRGEKIDYYLSAANAEYHFCPISWDLEAVGPITLKLEPRSEQIGGLNEMG